MIKGEHLLAIDLKSREVKGSEEETGREIDLGGGGII